MSQRCPNTFGYQKKGEYFQFQTFLHLVYLVSGKLENTTGYFLDGNTAGSSR